MTPNPTPAHGKKNFSIVIKNEYYWFLDAYIKENWFPGQIMGKYLNNQKFLLFQFRKSIHLKYSKHLKFKTV